MMWKQSAYQVNMLIAGYDDTSGPELYYMDWLASLQKVSLVIVISMFNRLKFLMRLNIIF